MGSGSYLSDVLIVGGSHAGLSVALTLYRALHTCVVFDSDSPRNKHGTAVHLTPTWEHQTTEKLRETSREELLKSGLVTFADVSVKKIEKADREAFRVTDSEGKSWLGRKVVIATGVADVFPDIEGYSDNYTRGIFPCMFQFGYEQRGVPTAGLLAVDGLANTMHASKLAYDGHKFSDRMVIYTNSNPDLAAEIQQVIKTNEISIDDRSIRRLVRGRNSEVVVEFESGERKTEGFLVHRPRTALDRSLPDQLNLEYGPTGEIKVKPPFCETSESGVYAVGDCASPMKVIPNAVAMGAYAGAGLGRDLPRHVTGNDFN